MRVISKFTGVLLIGICGILAADAADNYRREVAWFEHDMRLDHAVVGDAIAAMVRRTWQHEGLAAARAVPAYVGSTERRLHVTTMLPGDDAWRGLDAETQHRLEARQTVTHRAAGMQSTLMPIAGPGGESLVLTVQEPLADEEVFSRGSWWRTVVVTLVVIGLCSGAAFASGHWLVGRPIRLLSERARAIGGGDLEHPVGIVGGGEFSMLAQDLEAMRVSLRSANAAVVAETDRRIATLEQLRHADRLATVGRLAAGVAHELGTPLNVVGETAKMIQRGELLGAELGDGAATIAEQSQRMAVIIRQLLDFARPRTAVKERVEMAPLVERTLRLLEAMAHKGGVALRQEGECGGVDLDPAQFQQVLTNLVVNAVQATPRGGSVTVALATVVAEPPHDVTPGSRRWLRCDVRDTGQGISAENQRRLFEPFFTTKGVGEGTGLGLSVSRGIVREHGGWIEVTSDAGKGACFSVFLPLPAAGGGDAG